MDGDEACERLSARIKSVSERGRWSERYNLCPRKYFDLPRILCGKAESWRVVLIKEKKFAVSKLADRKCDEMIGPGLRHAPAPCF